MSIFLQIFYFSVRNWMSLIERYFMAHFHVLPFLHTVVVLMCMMVRVRTNPCSHAGVHSSGSLSAHCGLTVSQRLLGVSRWGQTKGQTRGFCFCLCMSEGKLGEGHCCVIYSMFTEDWGEYATNYALVDGCVCVFQNEAAASCVELASIKGFTWKHLSWFVLNFKCSNFPFCSEQEKLTIQKSDFFFRTINI